MTVSLQIQINTVRREVQHRMKKFPRLVEAGKMTGQEAALGIKAMQAVQSTLESLRKKK